MVREECEEGGEKKCIMGTTACIKEEQCIGPGSGGGMWRRLWSGPACLNQRFQKPEWVGERAAPPGGQTVFDTPPPLLSSLCSGGFCQAIREEEKGPKWRWWCIQVLMDTNCGDRLHFFFFQFNFKPAFIFCRFLLMFSKVQSAVCSFSISGYFTAEPFLRHNRPGRTQTLPLFSSLFFLFFFWVEGRRSELKDQANMHKVFRFAKKSTRLVFFCLNSYFFYTSWRQNSRTNQFISLFLISLNVWSVQHFVFLKRGNEQ